MQNPAPPAPEADSLARLSRELRAYLGGISSDLRADGVKAAPWGLLSLAKFLAWHAPKFDDALPGEAFTIADLAKELLDAASPLCGEKPQPTALPLLARIDRLEGECANLRECLANRKGQPV